MGLFNADVSVKDEVLTWLNSWRVKEEPDPMIDEAMEVAEQVTEELRQIVEEANLGQQMAEAHDRIIRTTPPSITREDFDRFFNEVMGAQEPPTPARYQIQMTLTEEAYNSYREWEAGQEMGNDILAREITVIQQPVNAYYLDWNMRRYPMYGGLCTPSRWGRVTGHRHG